MFFPVAYFRQVTGDVCPAYVICHLHDKSRQQMVKQRIVDFKRKLVIGLVRNEHRVNEFAEVISLLILLSISKLRWQLAMYNLLRTDCYAAFRRSLVAMHFYLREGGYVLIDVS